MAVAKKNTEGVKPQAVAKPKSWVVPVEGTVTGFMLVTATDEDNAIELAEELLEKKGIYVSGESTVDLTTFGTMVQKGEVGSLLVLEEVEESKVRTARKTPVKKETAAPSAAPKGRTRGRASTTPDTGEKDDTKTAEPKKAPATKTTSTTKAAPKGRTRGGATA